MFSTNSYFSNACRWLNEPELVARFQRLCGVEAQGTPTKNGIHTSLACTCDRDNPKTKLKKRVTCNCESESKQHVSNGTAFTDPVASGEIDRNATDWDRLHFRINNNYLFYIFYFGSVLGYEIFYVTFFPWWCWNIDREICWKVIVLWCFFMYVGQATKDILRWPRPSCPPVVRLETIYDLEYGMPSTHAMVGGAIPVCLALFTTEKYQFSEAARVVAFLIAGIWCILVCSSRIYLGMHSVLDVLVGLLYAAFIVPILVPYLEAIEDFVTHQALSPILIIGLPLFMCIIYPAPEKWSTARGDTTMIVSAGSAASVALWLSYHCGMESNDALVLPLPVPPLSFLWIVKCILRTVIGLILVALTRQFVSKITYNSACSLARLDKTDPMTKRSFQVELPYYFITYFAIGLNACFTAPVIFKAVGID